VSDSEVDVRDVVLQFSAGSDGPHDRALSHRLAATNGRRTEMRERHGVPVGRLNRHDFATDGDGAYERDRSGRRRNDRISRPSADVDPPVLARSVRIVTEYEFLEHGAFDRPGPGSRSGHND